MGRHGLLCLAGMALLIIGGCAAAQTSGNSAGAVGMNEAELVSQIGSPQQTIARVEGGKILVYEKQRLDQVAVMGGGAWGKPEQMYYWLDAQGKVEKVRYYPYGKRKFIFSSDQEREDFTPPPKQLTKTVASSPPQAPVEAPPPSQPLASPAAVKTEPAASKMPASASSHSMAEAARLELLMSKEDVVRLLGLPDRTEGFWAEGKQVMVWTYRLGDPGGRQVLTPLVFENGRLSGWGDAYYLAILRKVRNQTH